MPTPEEEQQRIQSRQREQLQREVQRVAAQGRGLLLSQGHRERKHWWEGRRWETLRVRLRTALVELAWHLVLWQPHWGLVRKWWPVLGNRRATRGARKKAIVAIARQLAVDLWRWRTGRVEPADLGWQMVGS